MIPSVLEKYRHLTEEALSQFVSSLNPSLPLQAAMAYALQTGGKRMRPILVFLIAEALGKNRRVSHAALAVEFFHTASLIADDLPCMDNDEIRRGVPTLHKVFNEATALLASYALIAAGYEKIATSSDAIVTAARNMGIEGATEGQFLDLFSQEHSSEKIKETIEKKTSTFFELSFVFGWLFGGGDHQELLLVKKAASHFGMAFQLSDDFLDLEQDRGQKNSQNYVNFMGVEQGRLLFNQEIEELKQTLKKLQILSPEFLSLIQTVEERVSAINLSSY